ncbi:SGNH/GDSL hydrolase family protein [Blastococcus xanthinilyticus]|uniref:Lysophospholipase L1-like esterase n=1 Tax=Blastococcus xanthinilyticus TaxID=1564164 RepID=A0A5S5CXC0_9ACTN|nr:SGNH/GDSL hydrolase family protein [Blastococcus xanthinilyticus]TYP87172.1 lysophospholipase L1-like esterase [Blastococcus xanthinilyticus]
MTRGRIVLLVGGLLVAALVASLAFPHGPTRRLLSAVAHYECVLSPADAGAAGGAVALGDSITAGDHFEALDIGADTSWFDVLACRDDSPVTYLGNHGVPGEESGEILARVDAALAREPGRVFVLAGTNDVREGRTSGSLDDLTAIATAIRAAGAEPLFATLPPSDAFPAETAAFNEELLAWAGREEVELLDFWTPLADEDGTFAEGMSTDGTHPSAEGAAVLADVAAAALG